tara:strand:- start:2398 stop:3327 length:930 start_codon:yes stop_codon:yes gene_type:complete
MKIKSSIFLILFNIFFYIEAFGMENKILLKVENEIITSIDLKNEYLYLLALNPSLKNLNKNEILEISRKSLIKEKIKNIEISKNIENPDLPIQYLERVLQSVYKKIKIDNIDQFKKYLKINKIEYEDVLQKISTEALWNELIILKFSSKIKIDQNYLKEKIEVDNNRILKSYLMSEIFFEISKNEDLQTKYNEIKKTINEKGFDNAALKYSISETSNIGGTLDWISENSMNKNIKKIIKDTKINEITNPITIPGGFLILKINDVKDTKLTKNKDEELKRLIAESKNNQLNQFSKMYFNKIKKNIQINEL